MVALVLAACAISAHAHTTFVESQPANGAVLEAAPQRIVLRFSTTVSLVAATLVAATGAQVAVTASADGKSISIVPAAAPPPDVYTLRWRIAGADSHIVKGETSFRIGAVPPPAVAQPAAVPAAAATDDDEAPKIAPSPEHARLFGLTFLRWIVVLALAIATGASLFRFAVSDFSGVPVRAAAVIGLAALVLLYLVLRLDLRDAAPTLGPALVAAGLTAVASTHRAASLLGAALALAGLSFWGHSVLEPRVLGQPLYVLHIAAAAFWIGSLWPLHAIVTADADPSRAVRRFSRLALVVVGVLVASGLVLAGLRLGSPGALLTTAYGRVVTFKLMVFALLLGLAAWNRLRLTPRLPQSAATLARSIDFELAIAVAIIAAAAWLSALKPPAA